MNRTEFMSRLEALLQGIPAHERVEAMQYYNDYFDEAGPDNEAYIVSELGSPAKVAATIKAGLQGAAEDSSQYGETGYTDTRFEDRETPAKRGYQQTRNESDNAARNNKVLKIILIALIAIIGIPIVVPLAGGLLATAAGLIISFFVLLLCLVIIAACIAIAGLVMVIVGIIELFGLFPLGLALLGGGLILLTIGAIGTIFAAKLCGVVIPAVFKSSVEFCRKLFNRKAVSM